MARYPIRKFTDKLAYGLSFICVVIAIIPLGSILLSVIVNGAPAISLEFLTQTPGAIGQAGGGIANAIQGTLILICLTSVIGVPLGVISGIYLSEFGDNKYGRLIRFFNDVLTGFPSIVVGILAYLLVVSALGSFSVIAAAAALSIIMLPIITRTTEESLRLVPNSIREASIALGISRWRTIVNVVLSTGRSGMITGILLSIARIAGETAPLIMTILGSQWFFSGLNQPMDALPLRIWRLALLPYDYSHQQGWGAALILILIVLTLNVAVRIFTKGKYRTRR